MKRKDFKLIIKLRSAWKIDKRRGNYKLPSGDTLFSYVERLVESQMELDRLMICENRDLALYSRKSANWNSDYILMPPFAPTEMCDYDVMNARIHTLVREIII